MNEDGTFNEEKARKRIANDLPEDKIDAVITKCKDISKLFFKYILRIIFYQDIKIKYIFINLFIFSGGGDECETAMLMMKCYAEEKAFTKIITEKSA